MVVAGLSSLCKRLDSFLIVAFIEVKPPERSLSPSTGIVTQPPCLLIKLHFFLLQYISHHAEQSRVFSLFINQFIHELQCLLFITLSNQAVNALLVEASLLKNFDSSNAETNLHILLSENQDKT